MIEFDKELSSEYIISCDPSSGGDISNSITITLKDWVHLNLRCVPEERIKKIDNLFKKKDYSNE